MIIANPSSRIPYGLAALIGGLAIALMAATAGPAAAAKEPKIRAIVEFTTPPDRGDIATVKRIGGQVGHSYEIVPALAVELPKDAIDRLERKSRVVSVERDGRMKALDYRPTHDWGIAHIKADQAHLAGETGTSDSGADARVAVTDTGIDCTHVELDENCTLGPTYVDGTSSASDDNGHGTHVAGSVAAERNSGTSAGVVGVAPTADVIAYKVLDSGGAGSWSDLIAAIDHIWNQGSPRAEVINMSLGGQSAPSALRDAFDRVYGAGVLPVAAAGNGGNCGGNNDSTSVPGAYDSVVATSAVDSANTRPCWSATGPAVELAAPGVSVFSTWPAEISSSSHNPQPVCEAGICHYKYGSGTSMASPHAAGAAGLLLAAGVVSDQNGTYGVADEVRQRLAETAVDLEPSGRDWRYGYGLIDLFAALGGTGDDGGNAAPSATFTYGCAELACDFDGSGSSDSDGTIASYEWDFGDGATASGATSSHAYASSGTYTVTLTVTDDLGASSTDSQNVSVSDGATATLAVSSISPNAIGTGTTAVTIGGSGFVSGSQLTVEGGKGPNPSTTVTGVRDDGSTLYAEIVVKENGPSGSSQWDVRVDNPDGSTSALAAGLTITR